MNFCIYSVLFFVCFIEFFFIISLFKQIKEKNKIKYDLNEAVAKYERLFLMALKWAEKNNKYNCVYEYLRKEGYSSIIIYGMHDAGNLIVEVLKNTDIEIVCGMDRNYDKIISFIKTIHPDSEIPKADAIIVTPVTSFMEIEEMLQEKVKCPIISLEDIIYD